MIDLEFNRTKLGFMQEMVMRDVHDVVERLNEVRGFIELTAQQVQGLSEAHKSIELIVGKVEASAKVVGAAADKVKHDVPRLSERTARLEEIVKQSDRREREALRTASERLNAKTEAFLNGLKTDRATLDGIRAAVALTEHAALATQGTIRGLLDQVSFVAGALADNGPISAKLQDAADTLIKANDSHRNFERSISKRIWFSIAISAMTLIATVVLIFLSSHALYTERVIPLTAFDPLSSAPIASKVEPGPKISHAVEKRKRD